MVELRALRVRRGSYHCYRYRRSKQGLFLAGRTRDADILKVIGTAVALNILLKIPLVAGCAITVVDVLIILFFYSTDGSMRRIRFFELFVMTLVIGVVICFCIELSHLEGVGVGEVFAGYLPSATVVQGKGYVQHSTPPDPHPVCT